jgi:hypothetical protein
MMMRKCRNKPTLSLKIKDFSFRLARKKATAASPLTSGFPLRVDENSQKQTHSHDRRIDGAIA